MPLQLPNLLCEKLCSLNPGVDRLTFSVFWKLDAKGIMSPASEGAEATSMHSTEL